MIQFNGREYASTDDMSIKVRAAFDRAMAEKPELHSGARLAAKLNVKIIMNGAEFNHAGEMSGRSTFVPRSARGRIPAKHCSIRQ
jgi:hypothetical protein